MKVKLIDIHCVCLKVKSKDEKLESVFDYLKKIFSIMNNSSEEQDLKRYVHQSFFPKYFKKWENARRIDKYFMDKNKNWLNTYITLAEIIKNNNAESSTSILKNKHNDNEKFINLSERSKKRKVEQIRSNNSTMICYAAALNLKNEGNKLASNIVKEVALKSPSRADYFFEKTNTPNQPQVVTLTPDEALSFMLTAQLTKHQYLETRKIARAHSANLYPPYSSILAAKLLTY